ncbi:MAG: HesA/MoeB/ThiF family protein [Proteobacteria bacterium]|nr:HesA/MoeB/ThiF family protein [Pseudomonadota bacterium]MBU1741133.1 HesA/MoeB/ThiF family protein [Pseudomonadota bacterium]
MAEEWLDVLRPYLEVHQAPGQEPLSVISDEGLIQAARSMGVTPREATTACLEQHLWPQRLAANRGTFTRQDQARLAASTVAVIGAGGLGGMVVLLLTRLGIGGLRICDHDRFEPGNLNRQFLCRPETLGRPKAEVAAEEVAAISPVVEVEVFPLRAGPDNLAQILTGAQVAVDCLDNMPSRYALETAAREAKIPYVHGAVAGLEGFVMTVLPGEPGLAGLHGPEPAAKQDSAEVVMGIPAMTPAAVATLQVNEVVKLLLDRRGLGPRTLLHLDLSVPSLELLRLG